MAHMSSPVSAFAEATPEGGGDDIFAPEPPRDIHIVPLHGRDVSLRPFNDSQFAQLSHEAEILEEGRYNDVRRRKAMNRCFRILQSMFVNEDDQDFAADLMADGKLDIRELFKLAVDLWQKTNPDKPAQVRRGRAPARRK